VEGSLLPSINSTPKRKKHTSRISGKLQKPLSGTMSQGAINTFRTRPIRSKFLCEGDRGVFRIFSHAIEYKRHEDY
jgi:hypothetical protein